MTSTAASAKAPPNAGDSMLHEHYDPVDIQFVDITYTVVKKGTRGEKLQILKGVSGRCKSGRVLAIMGSSGAGKTTLLDILAGHTFGGGEVGGEILVNRSPVSWPQFQSISCYVLQRDVLLASSTVKESLVLAALLKLPAALSREQKMARVDAILKELDLEGCADTLIGDELQQIKGISGGQKRRVSVGMELVKDPQVLFLDEPTSGLDSEVALSVMESLVHLARKGRTVAITIHQPNSLITSKFDDIMLMGAGRCVYAGPWDQAVDFFATNGFTCPMYQNPTDFFMFVLKTPETIDTLADSFQKRLISSPTFADLESGAKQLPGSPTASGKGFLEGEGAADGVKAPGATAGFVFQVWVLMGRMFKMWIRNPNMLVAELAQYLFMAIFMGLMYLQLNDSLYTGVNDRAASVWFGMAVLSFTPSFTAVTMWDRERLLLRRETSGGMYSIRAWFTAKTLTVTPMQVMQTVAFGVIAYFMIGYVIEPGPFFVYMAAYILFQLTSESIGVLCGALTTNATYAVLALTFVLLFLLSFSGFLVSDIPVYFRWVSKVTYLTYAYAAVIKSQFNATTFYGPEGKAHDGSSLIPPSIDNGLSVGVNLLVLFAITVGTRLLAYIGIEAGMRFKFI